MSQNITFNGQVFVVPDLADPNWGQNLTDFFVAIPNGCLQPTSSLFALTSELDFGPNFGVKSLYFKSRTANPGSIGAVRLANTDKIVWRNAGNSGDLALEVNGSNELVYNGMIIGQDELTNAYIWIGSASNRAEPQAVTGDIGITNAGVVSITAGSIVNADINASAAIAYSKLNLSGSIVNADISGSAGIVYSKLSIVNSIVNADINSSAGIVYSKLALSNSILNADINASASIAFSKMASLTASRMLASDGSGVVSASGWGYASGNLTTSVNGELRFVDGTTNYVALKSPASVTSYTLNMPIATGINGQYLQFTTGGQLAWNTPSGTGTINAGTAGRFAYYASTGTALSDQSLLTTDGTNLTLTGGQMLFPAGSVSAPSAVFGGFTGTGIYSYGTNIIGFASNGNPMMRITTTAVRVTDGTISAPGLSAWSNPAAGFYYVIASGLRLAQNSIDQIACTDAGPFIYAHSGSQSNPSYTFGGDLNSGMYLFGADDLGFSTGGTLRARITSGVNYFYNDLNIVRAHTGEVNFLVLNNSASSTGYATVTAHHNNGTYGANMTMYCNVDAGNNRNTELWMNGIPALQGDAAGGVAELALKVNVYNSGTVNAIDIAKTGYCTFPYAITDPKTTSFQNNTNNLLYNGGFENWDFGTSFSDTTMAAGSQEFCPGWNMQNGGSGITWSQESGGGNFDTGLYSLKVVTTGSGYYVTQTFQRKTHIPFRGRTITLSVRVKTTQANKIRIGLGDSVAANSYSSYHTGSGNWETLSVTKTIGGTTTYVGILLGFIGGDTGTACTVYFDSCMLVFGSTAIDFASLDLDTDKLRHGAFTDMVGNQQNILINGGMEIWQRGTSFTDPTSLYTADMWWWNQSGVTTFTVSRESTIKELGNYSMKCVWTGGTNLRVGQSPLSGVGVGGPISVKARVRSNQPGCRIMAFWSGGNITAKSTNAHTGGDTFETLTATFQVVGNLSSLSVWIGWDSTYGTSLPGSGTMYIDSVMAVWGDTAVDFVEDDPATLMNRCQRHYQVIKSVVAGNVEQFLGQCVSTTQARSVVRIQPMGSTPIVTAGTPTSWRLSNSAGTAIAVTSIGSIGSNQPDTIYVIATVASGLVAGDCTIFSVASTTPYISMEA